MSLRKSIVRIIATGKEVVVKPYGFGHVDAIGNFYHACEVVFVRVIE